MEKHALFQIQSTHASNEHRFRGLWLSGSAMHEFRGKRGEIAANGVVALKFCLMLSTELKVPSYNINARNALFLTRLCAHRWTAIKGTSHAFFLG